MKLFRIFTLVSGLAAALSQGCGSDTSNKGPGGGTGATTAMGTGGGASASGPSTCTPTHCMKDPDYTSFPQALCDALDASPCAAENKAEVACSLANDTCLPDGNQDFSKVQAACRMQIDALDACSKAHM